VKPARHLPVTGEQQVINQYYLGACGSSCSPDLLYDGLWYPLAVLFVEVHLTVVIQPEVEHARLLSTQVAGLSSFGALLELCSQGLPCEMEGGEGGG